MYAEVPPEAISALRPQLQENKILIMRKIYIDNAKQSYKPVRAMYMIRLHPKTASRGEYRTTRFPKIYIPSHTIYRATTTRRKQ